MQNLSSPVESNQTEVNKHLPETVHKHLTTSYQQPFRAHSEQAFHLVNDYIKKTDTTSTAGIILDSGCGTGESSYKLAGLYPKNLIIGIDKSMHRLARSQLEDKVLFDGNVILVRADLIDFWRLAVLHKWKPVKHYMLYPNPWPKKQHLGRRWHGHPVFPELLKLGGKLEIRSNWKIYIEEFAIAMNIAGQNEINIYQLSEEENLSPFEKKYKTSGHKLFVLEAKLNNRFK